MKLAHMRSRAGRRGGKLFQNGPLHYGGGRPLGQGTYNSTGKRDRRPGAGAAFHGHGTLGTPPWAASRVR